MSTVPTAPHAEIIVWARTEDEAVDYLVDELGLDGDVDELAPIPARDGLRPFRFVNLERVNELFGCTGMPTKPLD